MALKIEKWIDKINIADDLDDEILNKLGAQVCEDYEIDLISRESWESRTKDGLDLAMQVLEEKTWPWPKASNVKFPLIAEAAIQFHARAYPEIIRGNEVVKAKVIGYDPSGEKEKRAERIGKHMSYQVLEEMVEWEEDTDRLLIMLPIIGTLFKKTYFCPIRQRNVSCLRKPFDVVVHNDAKSIDDARRITDIVSLYNNDVVERKEMGIFRDIDYEEEQTEDEQRPKMFLEQHLWADLDDDGYEEPYCVTVHQYSKQVARIVPRYDEDSIYMKNGKLIKIEPIQYFTKFSFLPSFDGSFYDLGFGQLLMPLNESINTNLNQLNDAGTLANVQGGLISRGIKVKGGKFQFAPGEWKMTDASPQDLRDGLLPLPVKPPSPVLFQLLSMMVEAGRRLTSVSDLMTGEQSNPNEPATSVIARLEQGMKVFNGIHKRIYRALKSEYKKLAMLNKKYMDDQAYFRVLDLDNVALRQDYNDKDIDVIPVADPAQGTDIQRMAKARALMEIASAPGVDSWEVVHRFLQSLNVADIDKVHPAAKRNQPAPPDPKMIELQGKLEESMQKLRLQMEKQAKELEEIDSRIELNRTIGIKNIADAESKELGPQIEFYKQALDQIHGEIMTMRESMYSPQEAANGNDGGAVQGMEAGLADGGSIRLPEGIPAELGGEIPAPELGGGDLPGSGVAEGGIAGP